MVIAYVWAGLSALSPDRADLTTLSPIGSSKWFDRGENKSKKWKNWPIPSQELIEKDRKWVKWGHFGPPQARKFWGLGLYGYYPIPTRGTIATKHQNQLWNSVELHRYKQKRAPASNLAQNLLTLSGFLLYHAVWGSLSLPGDQTMSARSLRLHFRSKFGKPTTFFFRRLGDF